MTLLFLALWLQMSAPQIDFNISTIDNVNDFCASSAQCFPVLIDPSAEGYGPLKGTPDKGKIACEVKKDHMRCINAFGATVTLNFDDAGEAAYSQEFAEAAQRAADETDGKRVIFENSEAEKAWRADPCPPNQNCAQVNAQNSVKPHTHSPAAIDRWYLNPDYKKPTEPVDVPAVQEWRKKWTENCWTTNSSKPGCMAPEEVTTCADKSRVLLTSEDGKKHCIEF